ncbi:Vegetative protein [Stigmatella aurantiaca DW4/3-1]|uniref:Vegetative protein n=1 Tax=Stigmatella aurantiaca (strain DW4/3-1) TaxID=378806 RepID=E3FGF3_STIAD|nr:Vegetative protein [Stigmatella aurantiaca DW4/3-1]
MQKTPHTPVSKAHGSSSSTREPLRLSAPKSAGSLESAFRAALNEELARPLASLIARLAEVAKRFAPGRQQAVSRQRPGHEARTPPPAQPKRLPLLPFPASTARACAVIGCQRIHRSQGYCAAHYQKRRLMVATGLLHSAWVEDAAPHSIPEVILPRGRRPKADVAPATLAPTVKPAPRMWVRKKGADGASSPGAPTPAGKSEANHLASESERATATAQRWASEFRSRTRRA